MKKLLNLIIITFLLCGCFNINNNSTLTVSITKDDVVDRADIDMTSDEFSKYGFDLGDSLDIEFSNGVKLTDVPYLNGYYLKIGSVMVVAYPNADRIVVCRVSKDFWSLYNFKDGDTATFTLNTKGKYLSVYNTLGEGYSLDRDDYESDEEFANFRCISGGNLKDNLICRGASPIVNRMKRASISDELIEKYAIKTDIDLSDSIDKIEQIMDGDDYNSPYFKELYENGDVIALSMGPDATSDSFKESVKIGIQFMLNHDGPYYLHCVEGKDRTGIVCIILESLANFTYEEIRDDYMLTYYNYYKIKEGDDAYEFVVNNLLDSLIQTLCNIDESVDLTSYDLFDGIKKYLLDCGLTDDEINDLVTLITK